MNHAGMPAHAELTRRQSLAALAVRLIWMQPAQQEAQTTRGSRRLLRMAHRGEAGAVLSSSSCPHAPPPPSPPCPGAWTETGGGAHPAAVAVVDVALKWADALRVPCCIPLPTTCVSADSQFLLAPPPPPKKTLHFAGCHSSVIAVAEHCPPAMLTDTW